jgi:hypothetical protein
VVLRERAWGIEAVVKCEREGERERERREAEVARAAERRNFGDFRRIVSG